MQYSVDTLSIEIGRLLRVARSLKARKPADGHSDNISERITEIEYQIKEMKKAIGVLKEYVKNNTNTQYSSRYADQNLPSRYSDPGMGNRYTDPNAGKLDR